MFITYIYRNIFIFQFQRNHKKKPEFNLLEISGWNSDQPFSYKALWAYIRLIVRRIPFSEPAQLQPKTQGKYLLSSDLNFHHGNTIRNFSILKLLILWAVSLFKKANWKAILPMAGSKSRVVCGHTGQHSPGGTCGFSHSSTS